MTDFYIILCNLNCTQMYSEAAGRTGNLIVFHFSGGTMEVPAGVYFDSRAIIVF